MGKNATFDRLFRSLKPIQASPATSSPFGERPNYRSRSTSTTIDGTSQASTTGHTNPAAQVVLDAELTVQWRRSAARRRQHRARAVIKHFPRVRDLHERCVRYGWRGGQQHYSDNYIGTDFSGTRSVPNSSGFQSLGFASPGSQATGNVIRNNLNLWQQRLRD